MPQLSPLKWWLLFILSLFLFMMMMTKINYMFTKQKKNNPKINLTNKNSLKWKF